MAEIQVSEEQSNGLIKKVRVIESAVNRIGIPSLIVLVILTLFGLTWAEKIPSPFVSKSEMIDHQKQQQAYAEHAALSHTAIIAESKKNVEAMNNIVDSLRMLNCKIDSRTDKQVECYNKMIKESLNRHLAGG